VAAFGQAWNTLPDCVQTPAQAIGCLRIEQTRRFGAPRAPHGKISRCVPPADEHMRGTH
jgi:hypothetical protein